MNTQIQIHEISFFENSTEVTVRGIMHKDALSYESELVVSNSFLNPILNFLQKNNPDISVFEQLRSFFTGDLSFYQLSTDRLPYTILPMELFSQHEKVRLIRA